MSDGSGDAVPEGYLYSERHEWLRRDGDKASVGITDHAQHAMGDIVFVELPAPGRKVAAGEGFAAVESVKAAEEVFCPASGEVLEANGDLSAHPERVNQDPYGGAWIAKIRLADAGELSKLMDAAAYREFLKKT